ncbi:zinc finger domain-containing protein [Streptomyces litmocidini]|uniref:zinc finger domain-containing protein n=1 Tax=Streptomyces litmocidini TaxID=67318 RepID=UPI0036F4F8C4
MSISRLPANEDRRRLKAKVEELVQVATGAGRIGEHRQVQLKLWRTRLRYLPFPPRPATPLRQQEGVPLHQQLGRAYWTTRPRPQCRADSGQQCVVDGGPRAGRVRQVPHADRLRPVIDELQEQKKRGVVRTMWQAYDVTCPHCGQEAGAWCLTPGEPHSARSKRARELTEQQEPRL